MHKCKVLLTIDTELSMGGYSDAPGWLTQNLQGSIHGTPSGEYGLPFQLRILQAHRLHAVFFVEALAPVAIGLDPLRRIVRVIQEFDQEIQLHVHTEWLAHARSNPLGGKTGHNVADFDEGEQLRILQLALANMRECGVDEMDAFRAGNYGADNRTLRALKQAGLKFDSSYNIPFLGGLCRIRHDERLSGPTLLEGVIEVPVTCFTDRPGHVRPVQLCACSFNEIVSMLEQAYRRRVPYFVIVWHSFELLNRSRTRANDLVVKRFRRLCEFLGTQRERFPAVGFNSVEWSAPLCQAPLRSTWGRTLWRYAEQAAARRYE